MSPEEMLAEIERLGPWFHCVDLGQGIKTKSRSVVGEPLDHPWGTWKWVRKCLPRDLKGKSVLDVGCNGGFYAVEAKRRGAERVLAVDVVRMHVRQAKFVAQALNLDLEVRRASVYDLSPATVGRFDVTLALGLVYHLKHLVLGLEQLWQVTRERLILETAIYPPDQLPQPFRHPIAGPETTIHGMGYVANPREASESAFNWFLPGVGGLVALLENVGFEKVEVASVVGERAVLVCHQRAAYEDSRGADHLAAGLTVSPREQRARPGDELTLAVRAQNTGKRLWLALGAGGNERGAVRLGAHLFGDGDEEIAWDYGRTALPHDLAPGEAVDLELKLRAPDKPGRYVLELDMVSEHVAWFEDAGSSTLGVELTVSS